MQNPAENELRGLCAALGVHPLTIEDISANETSEKIIKLGESASIKSDWVL